MPFKENRPLGATLPVMPRSRLRARPQVPAAPARPMRPLSMRRPGCRAQQQQTIPRFPDDPRHLRTTHGRMILGISEVALLGLLHKASMEPPRCRHDTARPRLILRADRLCLHTMIGETIREGCRLGVCLPGQVANPGHLAAGPAGPWKWAGARPRASLTSVLEERN